MSNEKEVSSVSVQMLRRLPYYHYYLKALHNENVPSISSATIAKDLHLNEVQVRKDLAMVSSVKGKPKTGFPVNSMLDDIEEFLGYRNIDKAVLVGAGYLGKALMSYKGFDNYGLEIVAAFDNNQVIIDTEINGKPILPIEHLTKLCKRMHILIGIIAVPDEAAQGVCDMLVEAGVLGIWNFAPVNLFVPEGVLVQNENMAVSLTLLSKHLLNKFDHNE